MTLSKPATTLVLLAVFLCTHTPAHAGPITGRTVQSWIEGTRWVGPRVMEEDSYNVGKLHGYLSGMADAMVLTKAFCPPPGLHQKDLQTIVEKFLERDHSNLDAPASPRIMQVLRQTYPCSTGERKGK